MNPWNNLPKRVIVPLLWLVLAAACGDYEETHVAGGAPAPKQAAWQVALDSAWAYIDPVARTVLLVDGHGGVPHVRTVPIGNRPVKAERRIGHDQLLLLTQGVLGGPGVPEESAQLTILPAADLPPVQVSLDARYDDLAQSADGRFIVLFFSGGAPLGGQVAFNPNQMSVVDLAAPVPVVQPRSVPSLGSVPTGVDVSPPLTVGGEAVSLLVVRSNNYITLLDLARAERGEISIPLTLPDDQRSLRPVQVLFDASTPGIFLRVNGSSDIFAIRLAEVPGEERMAGRHNFRAVLSQLAAGREPSDMRLYDAGEGPRLLVAGADQNLYVVDAASSRVVSVPVEHDVSAIALWTQAVPGDATARPQALLVSATVPKATFVDLQKLESLKTRNLDVVTVPAPSKSFQVFASALGGPGFGVMLHANRALTVLDLGSRSVTPISSAVGIEKLRHHPGLAQLWLITPTDRLGALGLVPGQLTVGDVRLDAPVSDVLVSMSEPDGKARLLVSHQDAGGYVTVLDALAPSRTTAKSLRGFMASGLIARAERNVK